MALIDLPRWSWFVFFFLMHHCIYGHFTFSLMRLTKMKTSIKLQKGNESHCPSGLILSSNTEFFVCFSQHCGFFSAMKTRLEETSMSVFQPPAQGRGSTAFVSCCSRLCPVGSRILPMREIPQPPWAAWSSALLCSCGKKTIAFNSWSFQRARIASLSPQ